MISAIIIGVLHNVDDSIPINLYLKRISNSKTVFFTREDQTRICKHMKDSTIQHLLKEKYQNEEGFIIAGTIAGAMCLPEIVKW